MSFNILELVKEQVSGVLANKASDLFGASEDTVNGALGGIFPTILGSMIEKGSTETGANGIMGMIKGLDLGMLDDVEGIFDHGEPAVNRLLNSGGGIVDGLLGKNAGGVVDLIAKISGLDLTKTGSLLKMAAPFLFKIIAKKVGSGGISGLVNLLMDQKEHVQNALPAGMGSLLGLSSLSDTNGPMIGDLSKSVAGTAAEIENVSNSIPISPEGNSSRILKWLIPLALAAILSYVLMTKGCGGTTDDGSTEIDSMTEPISDVPDEVGEYVIDSELSVVEASKEAFKMVDADAKAALDNLTIEANSAGKQMLNFINGGDGYPVFRLRNIRFHTGSALLDVETAKEIDHVAAILKAYPDVNIGIMGHTDNTGDAEANRSLSIARAESVRARLIAQGVAGDRMAASGMGDSKPITTNDTEEGRAENRRIEIGILAK